MASKKHPPMTEPQYGLPTDGGARGPSGSQYGDAVGPIGSANPPMTEPQYGLPTDGGAGGPSGSQYGDAVGPIGSANPPMTEPQYGLPTDGGARGPGGSAAAARGSGASCFVYFGCRIFPSCLNQTNKQINKQTNKEVRIFFQNCLSVAISAAITVTPSIQSTQSTSTDFAYALRRQSKLDGRVP
jgi:hypothetical protein